MEYAQLSGASIAYRRVGRGDDVVMIHGMAATHGFWHLNVLLPLTRRFRVTIYDQRGHGNSSMPHEGYTSAHLADDLLELLDSLGIQRANLIGHSLGGTVALHFAVEHPDRVASLVVADARVRSLQPSQRPAEWRHWKAVKSKLEETGLEISDDMNDWGLCLLEQLASAKFTSAREKLAGTSLFIPFSRLSGGQRAAERWITLLQTTSARCELTDVAGLSVQRLAEIACPVMAIYGEKSALLPSQSGLKAILPDCRGVVVPDSGHFFPISCADRFVGEILNFLGSLESDTPARFNDRRQGVSK
jgi:pimeloyl-ACP methyl ester carboxylesterase